MDDVQRPPRVTVECILGYFAGIYCVHNLKSFL